MSDQKEETLFDKFGNYEMIVEFVKEECVNLYDTMKLNYPDADNVLITEQIIDSFFGAFPECEEFRDELTGIMIVEIANHINQTEQKNQNEANMFQNWNIKGQRFDN